MNPEEVTKPAGKLLRVGQGQAAYSAFVPAPLPAKVEWDEGLIQVLSNADRALGELAGLGRSLPNPHLLIGPFLRREAVLSSRIEGTRTDITDLYVYEAGQLPLPGMGSPESDVREVFNYVRALEYGLERLHELPVSLRLIREIHGKLMEGVRGGKADPGEFRHTQNWIGPPGCTLNEATYVPPPVDEMKAALGALEIYLHEGNQAPPLVRLACIHYQFEAIHPFIDGNGRIGRLLLALLLVHWNLLPLPLLYLSAYFERNRQQYYDLLLRVSQESAWKEWLEFFLHGVAEQARDAVIRARKLQDLRSLFQERLLSVYRSSQTLEVADLLFDEPVISALRIVKQLGCSHQSAMQSLRRLEKLDIIRQKTEGKRNRLYFAQDIFSVLE
jgi:Fic family protein